MTTGFVDDGVRARAAQTDGLSKLFAVFMRDNRLALSYDANFWLQWVGVFIEITIAYFIGTLVPPSAKFGFDGHPHHYFDYLVVNTAFMRFQSVAVVAFAMAIRDGQTFGTLELILSTPTSLPFIVLSAGLYAFVYQLIQSLVFILVAIAFGLDVSHANPVTLMVFLLLMIAAVTPIGVIAASATMVFKKTGPVEFFLTSVTQLFGGVYIPIASLPIALRWIGTILPVAHALTGIRAALQGATIGQMLPDVFWLLGLSAFFIPISLWLFTAAVHRAKLDGTLGQY
jgi:ABC-type polysaccharide/polyol phosphate export permease